MSSTKKIVLITGGNNGIGLATSELFAQQSQYHVVIGSRSLERGQKALESIQASTPAASVSVVQIDITDDKSIAAAAKEVESKHGHLDVLINNAAICPTTWNRADLNEAFNVNATSPALVTDAFEPLLLKSSDARIIYVSTLIASIGLMGTKDHMPYNEELKAYCISKAATNMVVSCDAAKFAGKIKVFAFHPGYVVSDLAGHRQKKMEQGIAVGPETSAKSMLIIAEGKRDEENGKFLYGDNVGDTYPW